MSRPTESIADLMVAVDSLQRLVAASPSTSILAPNIEHIKNRLSRLGQLSHTDLRASQDPVVRVSDLPGAVQRSIYTLAPFPFLSLPAELRNKIYPFVYRTTHKDLARNSRFEFNNGKLIRRNTSALLFANKQIFLESQEYIYKNSQLYFEAAYGVPHLPPFVINIPNLTTYPSLKIWTQEIAVRTGTDHRRSMVNSQIMDAVAHFSNLKKVVVKITVQYCTRQELDSLLPFLDRDDVEVELVFVWDHNLRPMRTEGVFTHVRDQAALEKQMEKWETSWKKLCIENGYEEDADEIPPITWRIKEKKFPVESAQS